ncbi:plakophilin-3-like isoform X1 [Myxocyprinus asiaticus]|uniref:plakophilin-3-like isoform X1 n=1 Tax=Myxocyprinus asiaticus TaxID=70543 RepID=UPI0022224526|nr:plakophilin-3-like isoform X1 [Myxocyprinus asiaticus]XP_051558512.1 plakophilin-3-like isoform X1 [Myxocyprinus asiaticus]
MSAVAATEGLFFSALQPSSSVTTYAVPSDDQLGTKAKRVQQQVQQRMAEKASSLSRLNASQYSSTEYNGSSSMRYQTKGPGFSSKSLVPNGNRTMATPRISQYAGGFSSHSAVEMGTQHRISRGVPMPAVVGRPYMLQDETHVSGSYTNQMPTMDSRTMRRTEQEAASIGMHTLQHHSSPVANWMPSYGQSPSPNVVHKQHTLSGTLAPEGFSRGWRESEFAHQYSFKGPSHRTISRINNRQVPQQQQQKMGGSSMHWQQMSTGGSTLLGAGHYQGTIKRAGSVHSMKSVGRGVDVCDGLADGTVDALGGIHNLDMTTAVSYLSSTDVAMQMLGAAYIQHQCYHSNEAKIMVRNLKGIQALVQLFSSENQEVQRYATGATRNLIYENMDNKTALIESGGISKLIGALREPDDELRKNITGILWNLSSKDSLKEKLARESLSELTERVLVPLSGGGDASVIQQSVSEADIFYNTTGCLRNLSSVNERTRQQMRDTQGLVDSLVGYIQNSLQDGKREDKGVENCVCVLRNLSYQLYSEIPASVQMRLEGPTRAQDTWHSDPIGCFTPQSKKAKDQKNQELSTFSEVARVPKGAEWLWHPQIVGLYNSILQSCETNTATGEAVVGALQNITAGEARWASVLSRVALEQERMLPVILDQLRSPTDAELRSLTGLLRNLSRHSKNKADMATKVVNILVAKLPSDGHQKDPSSDVVVNICGVLNNLVTASSVAARDITFFDGLPKLVSIKTSHDNSPGKLKAARAASTVLCNMFQYSKLHRDYKQKGFTKRDFTDATI